MKLSTLGIPVATSVALIAGPVVEAEASLL